MEKCMHDGTEGSPSETPLPSKFQRDWIEAQDSLKRKLVVDDDFSWKIPISPETPTEKNEEVGCVELLKHVGGVDLSFSKEDSSIACATLVVLDFQTLKVVYEDSSVVSLRIPYVPGFLAFREAPILLKLLEKMRNNTHPFYPQLLMVDGNGLIHPRGFGLACHLGVLANLPTIGIGKNLHHVDGLTQSRVKQLLEAKENCTKDLISLTGDSGHILGAAMRSTLRSSKPIFVSVGHRISLATAVKISKKTCKFRIPEPIRQADIVSREFLRKNQCLVNIM